MCLLVGFQGYVRVPCVASEVRYWGITLTGVLKKNKIIAEFIRKRIPLNILLKS